LVIAIKTLNIRLHWLINESNLATQLQNDWVKIGWKQISISDPIPHLILAFPPISIPAFYVGIGLTLSVGEQSQYYSSKSDSKKDIRSETNSMSIDLSMMPVKQKNN